MASIKNEFLRARVAKVDLGAIASSAATQAIPSGVFIPGGALVTGVTYMATGVMDVSVASQSINLYVANTALSSSIALVSSIAMSGLGAQTVPYKASLLTAAGMYVAVPGELVMSVQAASGGSVVTYSPSIYVGYIA
jgi:hypothetical protein